jgi:hypothetical protein
VKLQDFHSGGTGCSPTRPTVLTGRNHFRDCVDYVYLIWSLLQPRRLLSAVGIGDEIRAAGSEYEDGSFFAGKWYLGAFINDSEALGGITSSPISNYAWVFTHERYSTGRPRTATLNCQCRKEWLTHCNFGHYNRSEHCQLNGRCCFNYWWDDPLSPHGVTNLTWPTKDDDLLYLADSFSRFLACTEKANRNPFLCANQFPQLSRSPFIGSQKAKAAPCARGETCKTAPTRRTRLYRLGTLDYYACLAQNSTMRLVKFFPRPWNRVGTMTTPWFGSQLTIWA